MLFISNYKWYTNRKNGGHVFAQRVNRDGQCGLIVKKGDYIVLTEKGTNCAYPKEKFEKNYKRSFSDIFFSPIWTHL